MPGIYEMVLGSSIVYVSADGRYLLQGDVLDTETQTNLTENRRQDLRRSLVADIDPGQTILFSPPEPKHTLTVFTDIDCGYCRKLHQEMAGYYKEGIAIRYLFFPRSGPGTPSARKAESVWCAADQKAAMTDAKNGRSVPTQTCENPVNEHFRLAHELGIRGTPTLVTEDGTQIGGYLPPAALAARLAESGS